MTLTLTFLALIVAISFGILLVNILTAPEGYQDESGFHAGSSNEQRHASLSEGQLKPVTVFAKVSIRQVAA